MADESIDEKQEPNTEPETAPEETELEQGSEAAGEWQAPERGGAAVQLAKPKTRWYHWFMPRSSRENQARTLQKKAASDVGELLHAVSHHLDRQAQVQERLLSALERLPEAIEGMQKVGQSAEVQTQVLSDVKRQLETSAAGMSHFEDSLNTLDATNRTAAETVASLIERSRETEEKLRQLVNRSERRMTLLLGVLGLAFIAVVGGALYYGVTGRPLPAPFGPRSPAYREAPRSERLPPVPATREPEPKAVSAPGVLPQASVPGREPGPVDTTSTEEPERPLFRLRPDQEAPPLESVEPQDAVPAAADALTPEDTETPASSVVDDEADAPSASIIQRVIQSLRPDGE